MGNHSSTEHINSELNRISSMERVLPEIEAQNKLGLNKTTAFVEADAFIGNPYSLLGRVIEVRKGQNSQCPNSLFDQNNQVEFSINQITGFEEDLSARFTAPIQRGSIIVNKELSSKVSFLSFLSAQLDDKSTFSLVVFDEAAGLVKTASPTWTAAVNEWKKNNGDVLNDPDICYVFTVIGFIQKNIIRKRFKQFTTEAQGGAYGLNLEGKLYTSTEDFSLDIRFGLTPAILKRATSQKASLGFQAGDPHVLSPKEKNLFSTLSKLPSR